MHLTLPFPPSANSYWRHPARGPLAGRHLISVAGRKYREAVSLAVGRARQRAALDGRLRVVVTAHAPDRRKRDLDNMLKGLLDAMQHAGVYLNDTQIDDLRIVRGDVQPGGLVAVQIEPMDGCTFRQAMGDDV